MTTSIIIPTLALSVVSFFCSVFIILRIVLPILPPSPLSRRVAPAEFGLPNFRSLSPADKSHIWLASLDILALGLFVWQVVCGAKDFAVVYDVPSTIRLWLALTLRQTCLLTVACITLLHVRMGRSVSFGAKHWLLWSPTLLLVIFSTAAAGIISAASVPSLFIGLTAYVSTVAVVSAIAFICLIRTLVVIRRNLTSMNDDAYPWPPAKTSEEKPRPSFATEEVDAIRDGASWITSNANSRRDSMSQWSFSTHVNSSHDHSRRNLPTGSHASIPAKSSFWFSNPSNDANVPPVPSLPAPYGAMPLSSMVENINDADPFRRETPTSIFEQQQRIRMGSQTSWLTSSNGSHPTLSAWSYSTHHPSTPGLHTNLLSPSATVSRPGTPAMASAQVLGGYSAGNLPSAEKGLAALAAPPGTDINVSAYRGVGWLLTIVIPLVLALPYFATVSPSTINSQVPFILLALSVTLSSPLVAFNILFLSPIPIPSGLFDIRGPPSTNTVRSPSPAGSLPAALKISHEYKRSGSQSVTVVEGRRSGDVWIANGDAADYKNKVNRVLTMLAPKPKLSVLPIKEFEPTTPPLPLQMEGDSSIPLTIHNTPQSKVSAEMGRMRKDSNRASSHFSGGDESLGFAGHIMVAQRHYSALAQTVLVAASPPRDSVIEVSATGIEKRTSHLRSRSITNISPPPPFALPPTPPSVRAARLTRLSHKKSFSSGYSFGAVDDMNQIDALTAGVLPLLIPGLKLGDGMQVDDSDLKDWSPPGSYSRATGKAGSASSRKKHQIGKLPKDDGFSSPEWASTPVSNGFSSPEWTSTPVATVNKKRTRKTSHKNQFSLPSLGLGKNGVHSLTSEIGHALELETGALTDHSNKRNTVWGSESIANNLTAVREDEELFASPLERARSARSLGLRAQVPHGIDSGRSSMASVNVLPPSAASTVTLFELDKDGPQAESTPHNSVMTKPVSRHTPPPLPLPRHVRAESSRPTRRSSIVYIKSENDPTILKTVPSSTATTVTSSTIMNSFAQWSSQAKSVVKLQRKISNASTTQPGSPNGLRPLSLLQDRDVNNPTNGSSSPLSVNGIRPLSFVKKQKSKTTVDKNAHPATGSRFKQSGTSLKPLQLVRSETSKMQAIFRKEQAIPNVVVRPPSSTPHASLSYNFNA